MKTPSTFIYEQSEHGIATITLNRPERLNALTFDVYRELTDTFAALRDEKDVRVVVITGVGRAFCSGGDVKDIIGELFSRDMEGLLEFTSMTCELVRNIRALPKPVIASLNGTTAGAGACIALASDIRIATEDARIAFLFTKVGLSGADMGAAYLLPRVVGLAKATELLYTGDFISAQEAERIGLYNQVVPTVDKLIEATQSFSKRLAESPGFAIAKTKEMLNRELDMNLETALECEAQAQAICMQHPDYREAYEAFVAKRTPKFE
jgi:enoyl-CoA hydratase/carnithine racemase